MTYNDIKPEQARLICKQIKVLKNPFTNKKHKCCEICPLRRVRIDTDEEGNKREILLFCAYVLLTMYDDKQSEEKEILLHEQIQHEKEAQEWLNKLESVE